MTKAKPSLRSLRMPLTASDAVSPMMNWRAMPSMFERMVLCRTLATRPPAKPVLDAPHLSTSGMSPEPSPVKYSSMCRDRDREVFR